jgi:hypothetical protein
VLVLALALVLVLVPVLAKVIALVLMLMLVQTFAIKCTIHNCVKQPELALAKQKPKVLSTSIAHIYIHNTHRAHHVQPSICCSNRSNEFPNKAISFCGGSLLASIAGESCRNAIAGARTTRVPRHARCMCCVRKLNPKASCFTLTGKQTQSSRRNKQLMELRNSLSAGWEKAGERTRSQSCSNKNPSQLVGNSTGDAWRGGWEREKLWEPTHLLHLIAAGQKQV